VPNEHNVQYQEKKGIGWIILNRPEALNALSEDVLQRLASILDKVKTDDGVKAVMITGAGEKAFPPVPISSSSIRPRRSKYENSLSWLLK